MAVNLFLTTAVLSITGSTAYILLKLLTVACGGRLSQNWRYHSITAVSLLFILPLHKLWTLIPVPHRILPSVIAISGNSDPVYTSSSSTTTSELPLQVGPTNNGVDWELIIEQAAVLWLLVAVGLIIWNVWRLLHYRRQFEQVSNEVNGHLQQIAQDADRLAGVTSEVRLLVSSLVQSPMLVGFFRPTIVLPSEHLPDSDAQFILTHELTHFRRRDLWKKFLVNMIQCIHWFNPIVYLLNRDFAYWLETSCDEEVVSSLNYVQRKEYGYLLINYAPAIRHVGPRLYVSFTSCRYKLKRRISIMMKSNKKSRSLLGLVLALALVMGCMATTAFAAATDHASVTTAKDVFGQTSDVVGLSSSDDASVTTAGSPFAAAAMALSDDSNLSEYAVTALSDVVLPTARKNISLSSGTNYKYDRTYYEAGTVIDIYANWTPTTVGLKLGVFSVSADAPITSAVSGGEGGVQVTINKSGYFYIYVENTSSSKSADVSVSYAY